MKLTIHHHISEETIVKTIAYMMYYGRPRKGNINYTNIKEEITEIYEERGFIGARELLNQERFEEYSQKARLEYENLQLKTDRRIKTKAAKK